MFGSAPPSPVSSFAPTTNYPPSEVRSLASFPSPCDSPRSEFRLESEGEEEASSPPQSSLPQSTPSSGNLKVSKVLRREEREEHKRFCKPRWGGEKEVSIWSRDFIRAFDAGLPLPAPPPVRPVPQRVNDRPPRPPYFFPHPSAAPLPLPTPVPPVPPPVFLIYDQI